MKRKRQKQRKRNIDLENFEWFMIYKRTWRILEDGKVGNKEFLVARSH